MKSVINYNFFGSHFFNVAENSCYMYVHLIAGNKFLCVWGLKLHASKKRKDNYCNYFIMNNYYYSDDDKC